VKPTKFCAKRNVSFDAHLWTHFQCDEKERLAGIVDDVIDSTESPGKDKQIGSAFNNRRKNFACVLNLSTHSLLVRASIGMTAQENSRRPAGESDREEQPSI